MEIKKGIYLIVNPSMHHDTLLRKLEKIISEGIIAVQIWDNFNANDNILDIINKIIEICHGKNIPVLINNRWELLKEVSLDGVHFDVQPNDVEVIRWELGRKVIMGITCNNDLELVQWANEQKMDYISFCSIFPSSTANSCELVRFDTVREAKKITKMPIFLAGGITPKNVGELTDLNCFGIAVVSGIMDAEKPIQEIKKYKRKLK
ncbi:thiamine phosphate synthase [Riemerella anatipestifer]|uniref:thiamine phosphate synthase n=1 Tax=Riemerella anatipestifer TaxID=34085 RepID=UPI00129E0C1C|nr:thiamine phosphate synthase [Riemerella anatipestifer]MDY3344263.1 thiamine phosphate synthase [Riemerella anatipestifer]MDY3357343.1 thiamine phosphate synthase [Riemerella anatipestifer]MDY3537664.1 thiamine phosphate synthase [Riemerella anatipestifer]MRM84108.1 thiamine phosphate synthase [Riemerella anatipestifer]